MRGFGDPSISGCARWSPRSSRNFVGNERRLVAGLLARAGARPLPGLELDGTGAALLVEEPDEALTEAQAAIQAVAAPANAETQTREEELAS